MPDGFAEWRNTPPVGTVSVHQHYNVYYVYLRIDARLTAHVTAHQSEPTMKR